LNNKGYTLYDLGNYQEAINYSDKVLAIDGHHGQALDLKGKALRAIYGE
jgi:tetratricopeptide (TPR) repeat protein